MGTLQSQAPREDSLLGHWSTLEAALRRLGITGTPTHAEWHTACDIVRTCLAIQSANVIDEQLAGFGEILRKGFEKFASD